MFATRHTPLHALRWLGIGLLGGWLGSCAKPQSSPVIVVGNARFEFLTPSLVRMEYSPSARFVDAPTAVVQRRDWPAVRVEVNPTALNNLIKTSGQSLDYHFENGVLRFIKHGATPTK